MSNARGSPLQILRLTEVQARLGLAKSTIYSYLDPNSPRFRVEFPKPVRWGKSIGFVRLEVDDYIVHLMERRDSSVG